MPTTKDEYERLRCRNLSPRCGSDRETLHDLVAELSLQKASDDLDQAKREIERLSQELAVRQFKSGQPSDFAREFVHAFGKVVEITRQLFPDGPVTFEHAVDPESPREEWFIFDVFAKGEYKDYRERMFQWHDEVEKIVPGTLSEFRLSVMPIR